MKKSKLSRKHSGLLRRLTAFALAGIMVLGGDDSVCFGQGY